MRDKANVLVVGGAGYIGSHMVKMLDISGHSVVVLDNLSTGHKDNCKYGEFVVGDLDDPGLLNEVFRSWRFDCVMHFASHIEVSESISDPGKYYSNNLFNTQSLLAVMLRFDVSCLVFSSTAAVYGSPEWTPIDERHPVAPINPYGASKLVVEWMLRDYAVAYGLRSVSLRYFNAAGADQEGELGERHEPESHLIPLVLQAAARRRDGITIFGTDYDTPDGTAVRDYIHVEDLCSAHLLALKSLMNGNSGGCYNLGNGRGYSVREVIDTVRQVTGKDFPVKEEARRPGDPAILVADSALARKALGWSPQHTSLEKIIQDAWNFEQCHQ